MAHHKKCPQCKGAVEIPTGFSSATIKCPFCGKILREANQVDKNRWR